MLSSNSLTLVYLYSSFRPLATLNVQNPQRHGWLLVCSCCHGMVGTTSFLCFASAFGPCRLSIFPAPTSLSNSLSNVVDCCFGNCSKQLSGHHVECSISAMAEFCCCWQMLPACVFEMVLDSRQNVQWMSTKQISNLTVVKYSLASEVQSM